MYALDKYRISLSNTWECQVGASCCEVVLVWGFSCLFVLVFFFSVLFVGLFLFFCFVKIDICYIGQATLKLSI